MKKIFLEKVSQCRKTLKGGTLWDFPTSILSQNSKNIEGGLLVKIFFPEIKSHNAKKTEMGDPLVSPCMVCYAGKQEKTFLVQFASPKEQFGA